MSLLWYIQRIKTFSFAEIFYRMKQYGQMHILDRYHFYSHKKIKTRLKLPVSQIIEEPSQRRNYPVFETKIDIYKTIDWHLDQQSGKPFPKIFSHAINIRSDEYGSAKHVWEINRLLFLTKIAKEFQNTGDPSLLQLFCFHISSWVKENPYLCGVNWYSNIEVNIRLINWYYCWKLLDVENRCKTDSDFCKFVDNVWMPCIKNHCEYSYNHPSLYSSANNHLISEYAGLFLASSLWKFKKSSMWNHYAKEGLEKEIQVQNNSEGINQEEAAEYIQFIDDFFLIAAIVGRETGNCFSENYIHRLKNLLSYILHFLDCSGNYPMYGDGDDGYALYLDDDPHFNNFRSLLTSAVIFFNDPFFKIKGLKMDQKNEMLFGKEGRIIFDTLAFREDFRQSEFFPEEGHFIFRKQDSKGEIYLHLDAAPLGYLSIAAHGHADALSFILHIDGKPVLIDSGTYTYHTHRKWREYFMGTLAHNTVRINGENQARIAGPTLWLSHNHAQVLEIIRNPEIESVQATHDGYLKKGLNHVRTVTFNRLSDEFQIEDRISFTDEKRKQKTLIEIPFHIHPDFIPIQKETGYQIQVGSRMVELYPDPQISFELVFGKENPILGWYSEHFGVKQPCSVIYGKIEIQENMVFKHTTRVLNHD